MKIIFRWVNIIVSIGIFFIALGILYVSIPYFGNQALVVRSGSMAPAIDPGSIVVVRQNREFISPIVSVPLYYSGDIIAFRSSSDPKTIITHRIVGSTVKDKNVLYKTKGDANDDVDGWIVNQKDIVGKSYFTVPYAGYLLAYAKSKTGFPLLIIMPAVFVMLLELFKIITELKGGNKTRLVTEIRKHLRHHHPVLGIKIFVPLLMIGISIPLAFAFPIDTETSTNNVFTAAEVFTASPSATPTPTTPPDLTPTPTPTGIADHIVISEVQINGANANQDFVELYNPTNVLIDLTGYKIRVRNSAGNEDSLVLIPSGKSILAHGFFLWSNNQGTFETDISADVSNGNNISPNNSIALKEPDDSILDQLAWGNSTSPFIEGSAFATNPSSGGSLERKALSTSTAGTMDIGGADEFKGNGFDLNDNSTDFILRTLSQPQNSTSSAEMP